MPGLNDLPRNLLGLVALHLVVDPHTGVGTDPSALLPLLLTSRWIHAALQFDEFPQLYHDLYCATFDHAALQRRFDWMAKTMSAAAAASSAGAVAAAAANAGEGSAQPGGAGPAPAAGQREKPGGGQYPGGAGKGKKMFKLFDDPRSWAIDYKTHWELARRMKLVVRHGKLYGPGLCDKEAVLEDLWNIWFLLTENDGKNAAFLARECRYQEWIVLYYRDDVLRESLLPGYPRDTGDKALGIWCGLLSGTDPFVEQTAEEVDEKLFMLRPYVFACAKYDMTYAPKHHRRLPLGPDTTPASTVAPGGPPGTSTAGAAMDIAARSKAVPYKRFGYTWRRAPPHFVLGAYLVFLRMLERHPDRMSLSATSSAGFSTDADDLATRGPGLFGVTRILPSIYHDREWQRNSVCQDPRSSPGLPALTFAGELNGFWRGKFLFFDFELYRQILAGNLRALYTGTFAVQVAELELHETVVRVRKEQVGGDGPLLAAGFRDVEAHEGDAEQARVKAGYGHQVLSEDMYNELDEPGWTKEILISGRCRTEFGWGWVRGRVRAWDGLVILAMQYHQHVMSKWLWRGYLHTGGHLIGRWRDSFTDEHLRGYEGAFGMIRAGDIFWPPHYPTSMDESLGLSTASSAVSAAAAANVTGAAQANVPPTVPTGASG